MMNKSPNQRQRHLPKSKAAEGSWQPVHNWYNELVGEKGHYYHQKVILPLGLRLLQLKAESSLLDLACGQGILARTIPETVEYWGVDVARSLVEAARDQDTQPNHHFIVANLERPTLPIEKTDFTHASIILALQNISNYQQVFRHAAQYLQSGGKFFIVVNHPYYRIPRQSSWGVDETKKLQYRRVDRYLSPLKIPIQAHPGQAQKTPLTWSYHVPLSDYVNALAEAGFVVTRLEEWSSDKVSEGKAAKMENRSRNEIPLFMAILAEKR
jgi:ubiquinone/menaquinone biosynthesis C-methylase UbiE